MTINKDKLQELEDLKKSLADVLSKEELDTLFKSDAPEFEEEEDKDKKKDDVGDKKDKKEKSQKEDFQPRTEDEIKKSIADNLSELKKVKGFKEPSQIEKSLKDQNDKLEKSLSGMKKDNDKLEKSVIGIKESIDILKSELGEIGKVSQGTKHQVNFKHIEKSVEQEERSDGKVNVSIQNKDEFEKSVVDSWEKSEGAEKELLEKAVVNLNGSGRIAQDQEVLARIARAMNKQGYILTK